MLRAIGILAVSTLLVGCTDTSSTLITTTTPTLITVDPLKFRGAVQCGAPELQSYVVALTDVSMPASFVAVSFPVSCTNPTSFGSAPVIVDHFYTAKIDGYDRPPCDPVGQIFPAGCVEQAAPNSRDAVDHATHTVVTPRWQWQCGEVPAGFDPSEAGTLPPGQDPLQAPARAMVLTEVFLQGCRPVTNVAEADASTPDDAASGEPDAAAADDGTAAGGGDANLQPASAADGGD